VPSSDKRVCRLLQPPIPGRDPADPRYRSGCTGFIVNVPATNVDKAHLSAGHCFLPSSHVVAQFEDLTSPVRSQANCNLQMPPMRKQFAVRSFEARYRVGAPNDWTVFTCYRNPNTGLTTFQEQNLEAAPPASAAFDLEPAVPGAGTVRVIGYGLDGNEGSPGGGGPGAQPACNCNPASNTTGRWNQVQQVHEGPIVQRTMGEIDHQVDTCGGDSGAPIVLATSDRVVGIHTFGGCDQGADHNGGTPITETALVQALTRGGVRVCTMTAGAGEWVFSSEADGGRKILRYNPQTGVRTDLATLPSPMTFDSVTMGDDNRELWCCALASSPAPFPPSPILSVVPGGPVTTIATLPSGGHALDLDQDGTWLCAVSAGGAAAPRILARFDPTAGSITTLATFPEEVRAVCFDADTGDYMVASENNLFRIQRNGGGAPLLASITGLTGIDFEPRTGTFVVSRTVEPKVQRVTSGGMVTPVSNPGPLAAIKVDDETGNLLVVEGPAPWVHHLGPAGNYLLSRFLSPPLNFTGVEVYGSRKVTGSGRLGGDAVYTVRLSFPKSPCANYVVALSTSLRPGLPLGDGRVINLGPDALFSSTLGGLPGITTGFTGTLDWLGRGVATIELPAGFPRGVRVFCTAVAVNASMGAGLDMANSIGVTTE
jgi:hypothetical protein